MTIHGRIGWKPTGGDFTIDTKTAQVWATEHYPMALVPKLDADALKDVLTVNDDGLPILRGTGEVVEWATYTEPQDTFYVK